MKIAVFNTKAYDKKFLTEANSPYGHSLEFLTVHMDEHTATLAAGYPAVCVFVNDLVDRRVIEILAAGGTKIIALRCAGFNNVDLTACDEKGISVVNVPDYSPHAVAEHTVGLILSLNRKIHRAYARVREGNFSLDGLMGFDLCGRTAGVIGMGRIGAVVAQILKGFGMRVLSYDSYAGAPRVEGVEAVDLDTLFRESDVISLHCPLTPETHHIINQDAISKMKPNVMIINTSRGALIDSQAAIMALKSGMIGYMGLDVYEQEGDLFFEDLSDQVIHDDIFERLITFHNVIITGHQAFFTENALRKIADTTLKNVKTLESGEACSNRLGKERLRKA